MTSNKHWENQVVPICAICWSMSTWPQSEHQWALGTWCSLLCQSVCNHASTIIWSPRHRGAHGRSNWWFILCGHLQIILSNFSQLRPVANALLLYIVDEFNNIRQWLEKNRVGTRLVLNFHMSNSYCLYAAIFMQQN